MTGPGHSGVELKDEQRTLGTFPPCWCGNALPGPARREPAQSKGKQHGLRSSPWGHGSCLDRLFGVSRDTQEADGWQEGRDPAVCTFGDGVRDMELGASALM